jgi:ABC-type nitrate/sulfonate/bicarbonate transport system permease component
LIYRKYFTLLTGISLTGWLALWCLGSYTGFINPEFLTPPWELWSQFVLMAKEGYAGTPLFEHFYISLFRTLAGFALAILIGVPMGLLMGMSPIIHFIFNPLISLLRPIPTIAYIPLVILWFGIGEGSKIVIIFLSAFLFIVLSTYQGVLQIPEGYKRVALNLGANSWDMFFRVILPCSAPSIMTGIKISLAISWAVVVAAELIAAQEGLGYLISDGSVFFRLPVVYVGVILIGIVGFTLESVVTKIETSVVHWRGK